MLAFLNSVLRSLTLLVSYISNQNTFPKPLSREEEAECVRLMAEGDEAAKNKLIEHNLRLVAHIAKKYAGAAKCMSDNEDILSIGTIGLIKGINSYDASKGTRLATYAARCVENEILMTLRAKKKSRNDVSLNDAIGTDKEGNAIMLMDVLENDECDIFDEIQNNDSVKRLYNNIREKLTDRERRIIMLRYGLADGKCLTQREIAQKLGISRSYISRIEKKAISKLGDGIKE
ncbi:MAG TPA: RNA polymerase sporulation sigma factor SigK [Candidatus Monoglobus merdigallinarum]|uniref:RNA polymerase sigma factor n=1 Tax=Candidatus Monoglobus merdigallinarum TaxID=2838698 RepID=A0A9D1PQP2_9FIRM|nr:RNA polymerase sporulation sigma factor SigK [Candidatus Monoglobus merdigallinarum]